MAAASCLAIVGLGIAVAVVVSTGPSAVNRTSHNSYNGAQDAYWQEAQNLISQVNAIEYQLADDPSMPQSQVSQLMSQKAEIVTQTCGVIAHTRTPTSDVAQFASSNC